jgi:uncharacterized protein YkwD
MNCSTTASRRNKARLVSRAAYLMVPILLAAAGFVTTSATTASPAGATTVERHFTRMLNHARVSHHLRPLRKRAALTRVARRQAHRMAYRNRLYHNPHLTSEVKNWRWVGENVGYGPDSGSIHAAFMASAPHRANILDHDYTQVGIGAVVRNGRVWVAEAFRRPMHRGYTFRHTAADLCAIRSLGERGGFTNREDHVFQDAKVSRLVSCGVAHRLLLPSRVHAHPHAR